MYAVTLRAWIAYAIVAFVLISGVFSQVRLRRKRVRESGVGSV
jgi:hypothetical protein